MKLDIFNSIRWCFLSFCCFCKGNLQIFEQFQWKKPFEYYYRNIEEKLSMILMSGYCSQKYRILPVNSQIIAPEDSQTINVIPYLIDSSVYSWWRNIPKPKQMRVDPRLCSIVYLKKKPIFQSEGCQLPDYMSPSAPRCQTKYLKYNCDMSAMNLTDSQSNHFILPESDHQTWLTPPIPWIIIVKDAAVSLCGHISAQCGIIHTTANCRAYSFLLHSSQFRHKCPLKQIEQNLAIKPANESFQNLTFSCLPGSPWSNEVHYYDKVFVIAEVDDTYIYHIHLEIVPRIIYHLKFLLEHPEVKILYGCDTKNRKEVTDAGLQHGFQQMLSILRLFKLTDPDRFIIHQHVYAKEIYLPMEGGCQDPVYNTWMILHMRKQIFQLLKLEDRTVDNSEKRKVVSIVKRSANSVHTRNRHDLVRQWSDSFAFRLMDALQTAFPLFDVRIISDRNNTLMNCFECQVKAFAETDILIGVHGAGLGMALYLPPNSAVIEIAPYPNDGRCLLGGGPFSRLATVLSHNYMMHHPPYEEFIWKNGKTSEFNTTSFTIHTTSFLKSIGLV